MRTDLELLRVLSAFGILWFHSGYPYGRDVGYAGLIVFLVLSIFFAATSQKQHGLLQRFVRFIAPCILWSIIYAVERVARDKVVFPGDQPFIAKLLATPSIHLWYLPFIFFCIVIIDNVKKLYNDTYIAYGTATVACLLFITSPEWRQWNLSAPVAQYLHALPAVLIGVLFATCGKLSLPARSFLIGGVLTSILYAFFAQVSGVGITYFVGVTVSLILFRKDSLLPDSKIIIKLSALMFGVYLIHPEILYILNCYAGISSFYLILSTFIVSIILIYIAKRIVPKKIIKYAM